MGRPFKPPKRCRKDVCDVVAFLKRFGAVASLGVMGNGKTAIYYARDGDMPHLYGVYCFDADTLKDILEAAGIEVLSIGRKEDFECPEDERALGFC